MTAVWLRDLGRAHIAAADRLDQQRPAPPREWGVNAWPTGQNLARVARLGAQWVRFSIEMHWHTDGTVPFDWTAYDRAVTLAHTLDLKVLHVCQGMPATLAAGGQAGHVAPKDCGAMLAWSAWAAECATRGADAIEVGNEWNHPTFWGPAPDPAASATLTAFAADAIAKTRPGIPVVTGGLAPAGGELRAPDFLAAQTAAAPTMLDHVTGVGHHPYCFPADPRVVEPWNATGQTRAVADLAGGRPVWVTEIGSTVGPPGDPKAMGEDDQVLHTAGYLAALGDLEAGGVRLGPLFWYRLDDDPTRTESWESHMGMYRTDGSERPFVEVLTRWAARR